MIAFSLVPISLTPTNPTEWNQTNHEPKKYALRTYLLKMAVMVHVLQTGRIWQFHIVFAENGNEMYQDL